jgi:hypothetical protein
LDSTKAATAIKINPYEETSLCHPIHAKMILRSTNDGGLLTQFNERRSCRAAALSHHDVRRFNDKQSIALNICAPNLSMKKRRLRPLLRRRMQLEKDSIQ